MTQPVLAALLVLALTGAAAAQQSDCAKTEALLQFLELRFGEIPAAVGLTGGGKQIIRLTLAPSGSWTVIGEIERGVSCVLGSGTDWHFARPPPKGDPA